MSVAKKSPKLRLVGGDAAEAAQEGFAASEGFEFVTMDELSNAERKRTERLLGEVCPRAGVLAVVRTADPWDLRPVVALSDDNGPSILRLVAPEISHSADTSNRLRGMFDRLSRFEDLSSQLRDWGVFEGQIWYRRSMLPRTFAHLLSDRLEFDFEQTFSVMSALADEISHWHGLGIVHGHITSSNLHFASDGQVSLLDPGVRAALALVSKEAGERLQQTIAPEILEGNVPEYRADVYGFGQVVRRLFLLLRKNHQFAKDRADLEAALAPFSSFVNAMVDANAGKRPSISEVRSFLRRRQEKRAVRTEEPAKPAPSTTHGKVVKPVVYTPPPAPPTVVVPARVEEAKVFPVEPEPPTLLYEEPQRMSGGADVQTNLYKVVASSRREEWSSPAALEPMHIDPEPRFVESSSPFELGGKQEEPDDFFNIGSTHVEENLFVEEEPRPVRRAGPYHQVSTPREKPQASGGPKGNGWLLASLFASLVLLGWYYFRQTEPVDETLQYTKSDLRVAWESKIPSRMRIVAQTAISHNEQRALAESLIIRSVNNGDSLPESIDTGLLRIAFEGLWEPDLNEDDRRVALAIGLGGLLQDSMTMLEDLGPLDQRHPGVLFALTASAGDHARPFLEKVPAALLTRLPPPYQGAFRRLVVNKRDITCGDEEVRTLAQFSTHGVEKSQDLANYVRQNSTVRLQALALIFSQHNEQARKVLDVLLNHPNIILDVPDVSWGRQAELLNWIELDSADQLFVLSGIAPPKSCKPEHTARLFLHPSASLRAWAIEQILDQVTFVHPATVPVFEKLEKHPEMLTPIQLAKLATILEDPVKVTEDSIQDWLDSKPPVEIVSDLVLGTAQQKQAIALDAWLTMYLKSRDWSPDIITLRALITHPDPYTRLFGYNKIYGMPDKETALTFLNRAFAKENDPQLRPQLETMIQSLKEIVKH